MGNNEILSRNEQEANKLSSIITLLTIFFIVLVYILDALHIFIAPLDTMTIALGIATAMMLIPSVLVFLCKFTGPWVKYVIVTACIAMVSVMLMFLSWHVIVLLIYPIAIASLYFSRKLSWFALGLSLLSFSVSQVLSLSMGGVGDRNLTDQFSMIVYGIAPRDIELLALACIFITLSRRTKKLLENVVGAKEQKDALDRVISLTDKSYEVSRALDQSVKKLSEITDHTKKSNEEIAEKTSGIVEKSQQTMEFLDEAGTIVGNVATKLNDIAKENLLISEVSKEAKSLTVNNMANMKSAAREMEQIDAATRESRDIITRLEEKSSEISSIVEVIKGITKRTNLLALNATIESARAGEHGKGFAVVASEIRSLAEQSQQAANNISDIINTVLDDTRSAVNSIDLNTQIVETGLDVMQKADQSSEEVSNAIERMNIMANHISTLSTEVANNSNKITETVEGISKLTYHNMDVLMTIWTSSQEQLTAMNDVSDSVESINTTSEELLKVVKLSQV